MKVLMLTTSFPLYPGHPAGVFVFEQARHLSLAGIDVHVLAPWHPGALHSEVMEDIVVTRFSYFLPKKKARLCYGDGMPENIKKNPALRLQLPFLVAMFLMKAVRLAGRYDYIYAHWPLAGLAAVVAGKIKRKPAVVMVHHGQKRYGTNLLEKFVVGQADRLVCNSRFTMSRLPSFCGTNGCEIIPPGVDVALFKPQQVDSSDDFFRQAGIPPGFPVVLAVGRHIELKGFSYLIEAAAHMKGRIPFLLVIGGRGPETARLKKLATHLGVAEQVAFVGRIPNKNMPRLYNRADVFVLPSIVDGHGSTEGLGVVLIEAMACGTPCVASNVGGIPHIVRDGVNGFLTPPGDAVALAGAIETLLVDSSLNQSMGENGRQFIMENFSWVKLTSRTISMLASLKMK